METPNCSNLHVMETPNCSNLHIMAEAKSHSLRLHNGVPDCHLRYLCIYAFSFTDSVFTSFVTSTSFVSSTPPL